MWKSPESEPEPEPESDEHMAHTPPLQAGDAGTSSSNGRDARGRFLKGSDEARRCGQLGFQAAIDSIIARHPDAINSMGTHIAHTFMWWVNNGK